MHIVTSPCIGTHDTACAGVCPVNCFFDVPLLDLGLSPALWLEGVDASGRPELLKMLIISPDECIDCKACVDACPVSAIYAEEDVPESEQAFVDVNKNWFQGKDQAALDAARVP